MAVCVDKYKKKRRKSERYTQNLQGAVAGAGNNNGARRRVGRRSVVDDGELQEEVFDKCRRCALGMAQYRFPVTPFWNVDA